MIKKRLSTGGQSAGSLGIATGEQEGTSSRQVEKEHCLKGDEKCGGEREHVDGEGDRRGERCEYAAN